MRTKKAVFEVFFAKNRFSGPNGHFMPIAGHTYSDSYWSVGSFDISGDVQPVTRQIFCTIVVRNWQY